MASVREWIEGARLRTLSASVSPVVLGVGLAWFASPDLDGGSLVDIPDWLGVGAAVLCLFVALGFQIGSNFANDHSDGVRGTDDQRVGPMRLVGSGKASARSVKRAAWVCFGFACVAGLLLVGDHVFLGWRYAGVSAVSLAVRVAVIMCVGSACVWAAWFYTGGKRPYGYIGLGEVFVFVFFGLVAVVGSGYMTASWVCAPCSDAQGCIGACAPSLRWAALLVGGAAMGCFATAILVANNLRDIATDQVSGKITLAVRLGDRPTRVVYALLLVFALVSVAALGFAASPGAWLGLGGVVIVIPCVLRVIRGATGRELIGVLKWTGLAELAAAVLAAVGMWGVGVS